MKSLKIALILFAALVAGCSVSAGISRGQELESDLMPSVVVERDDMRRVHNSTVRIRAYSATNQLIWLGTGSVFEISDNRIKILSNNHVCLNPKGKITVEPIIDGRSKGEFDARVDLCVEDNGIDVAVVSLAQGKTLEKIDFVPIKKASLEEGQEIYWVGCDRGNQQNGQIGRILDVSEQHIFMSPKAIGGDSGSSVVQFDENGNPHVVALIAWVTTFEGEQVAMAMKSSVVLDVLAGGKLPDLPDEGDVPPSSMETERLIQGLLQRLQELRRDAKREREGLLNRLSEMQLQRAAEAQQTQLFRDLFKKKQEEQIEKQDSQESIVEKLSSKFDNLRTLLRWSFYAIIGLLIAALFFRNGWATVVLVSLVTFVFRTGKLAYLLIHNAIVAKVKNPKTMSEALEDLQDGISEGIGRKEDAP